MLDEEMDDMIRDAAENHRPPYNDVAWNRMEALLDQHMPQKKDRRRYLFFLLLFLGLAIGTYFTESYFFGNKKSATVAVTGNKVNGKSVPTGPSSQQPDDNSLNRNTIPAQEENRQQNIAINDLPGKALNDAGIFRRAGKLLTVKNKSSMKVTTANSSGNIDNIPISSLENMPVNDKGNVPVSKGDFGLKNTIPVNASSNINSSGNTDQVTLQKKNDELKVVQEEKIRKEEIGKGNNRGGKNDKNKSRKGFPANFGLTFSAGPDLSLVELNKPGKVTLSYGVGLQYNFVKRLTVRAGFYVAKKIYSSDSAGYHPPSGFWNYYPNMQNIDANCKVYELPVSLLYNFRQKKNHSFFAGAGISSYLMKTETYDYNYKTAVGQLNYRSYTISDKNKHYFSTITLSGGYQYELSKKISFTAEPYVKVPLTGIGFGKVKLKGTGVLFTATIKPFKRK